MKKLILILLCFNVNLMLAQSKYTLEQAQNSNDPKVVANFIVNNPNHPKTNMLKQKLAHMMMNNKSTATNSVRGKNDYRVMTSDNQQTAKILTHILNSNEHSKEAYISVKNQSRCPIVVNFEGKRNYKINVASNSTGRLLVDKGHYTISSKVCKAQYKSQRTINKDWELTLNTSY